ncbi:unnamed protein product [Dibothriocephalus latus]|uniref:Dynein light chain n=1 Tax=Dibothriocephalus latus TaxID=60516 RepID=A0A3P6TLV8_DIBLA|nr:unnamed protein product [Dibothriocephalus latus]
MNGSRTNFADDEEPVPKTFIVEKTDVKTANRDKIMNIIQTRLQDTTAGAEVSMAQTIKEALDEEMESKYWHCIVGKDFACLHFQCQPIFMETEFRALIRSSDMSEKMQQEAVLTAAEALRRYSVEWSIAGYIKKKFDESFYATWHCAVGQEFGRWV